MANSAERKAVGAAIDRLESMPVTWPTDRSKQEEVRDARTAALQQLRALGDGWLPIETAPKDGKEFLGWRESWPCPDTCFWDKRLGYYHDGSHGEYQPTHWQPLPQPPKEPR